jgi:DDE superfamily endonuclease
VITYSATLDVSRELACFIARLLRREQEERRTPEGSRKLSPYQQAVMALRWFRYRTPIPALARDNGISRATGYRYVDEVTEVLAAQAPDLPEALERAAADGAAHVILDGTIIPADRCGQKAPAGPGDEEGDVPDLWYSGKKHRHGGNAQAVILPRGFPVWISEAEPGSTHDLAAARIHALPALYHAAATLGLRTLADSGYQGAGIGILTPDKLPGNGQELHLNARTRNALLKSLRCLGERAFALLTQRWRTLQRITASPSKITSILSAALVLTHFEHGYLK